MVELPGEFSLRDVRCFQGVQQARLRPITLLIGENSTGKSSFLGCYSVMHRLFSSPFRRFSEPDFNEAPFLMGSFREIVRTRRGPGGRIDEFQLGLGFSDSGQSSKRVHVNFGEYGTQPVISSVRYTLDDKFLEIRRSPSGETFLCIPNHEATIRYPFDLLDLFLDSLSFFDFRIIDDKSSNFEPELKQYVDMFSNQWFHDEGSSRASLTNLTSGNMTALAPLRAQPKRTYDPVRETASPEGEHVPMLMMRLTRSDRTKWDKLHEQLVPFGLESGLFSDIKVKGHGGHMSDPFQLQIKARSGSHANIMDVGYGVSQSLPILVDVIGAKDETFILQQPEVHLHPRGQAELATFFIDSAKNRKNRFLIETHSDYIVDRVRINVRQGRFPAKDVSILYFEPKGNAVKVHSLSLDDHGNLTDAPIGYREFFAHETDRLLGFE